MAASEGLVFSEYEMGNVGFLIHLFSSYFQNALHG